MTGLLLDYEVAARVAAISEALSSAAQGGSNAGVAAAEEALSELEDQLGLYRARFADLAEASSTAYRMAALPGPGTQGLSLVGCRRILDTLRAGFKKARVPVPGEAQS